jgi:hypothetical protein
MTTFNRENLPAGTVLMNRRVRIVEAFPSLSTEERNLINGRTGTCKWEQPDSDGDIYVEFDSPLDHNGRTSSYVRAWEFLDGTEATLTPSEPVVVDKTPAEERLEALIDAVYEAARTNGYQSLLAGVMEAAGLPLRDSGRRLTLMGQRVVSVYGEEVSEALTRLRGSDVDEDVTVQVNRAIAEFRVTVAWPQTGAHVDCHDLNNMLAGENWASIPDDILTNAARAVGLRSNAASVRTFLTQQKAIAHNYGAQVSCLYC